MEGLRPRLLPGRVVALGARTLEDAQLEDRILFLVEAHRRRAGRRLVVEIGTAPVDDRHEVVADELDAGPAGGLEACDPGLDFGFCSAAPALDGIRNGDRFD